MYINPLLTGEENLRILLSQRLQRPVTAEDVAISAPRDYSFADGTPESFNTEVDISALSGSGLSGHLTVRYRRLNLHHRSVHHPYHVTVPAGQTLAALHTAIASELSIREEEVTLSLFTEPLITEPTPIKLIANLNSLLYTRYLDLLLHPPT